MQNFKNLQLQDLNSTTFQRFSSTFKHLVCFQALSRALKFLYQIQAFSRISQARYEPWVVLVVVVVLANTVNLQLILTRAGTDYNF